MRDWLVRIETRCGCHRDEVRRFEGRPPYEWNVALAPKLSPFCFAEGVPPPVPDYDVRKFAIFSIDDFGPIPFVLYKEQP